MSRRMRCVLGAAAVLATTGCGAGHRSAADTHSLPEPHAGVSMFFPAWSPDGKRIAWTQPTGAGKAQVWVARADGSKPHPFAPPIESLSEIAWLPGDRLVYWAGFALYRLTLAGQSSLLAHVEGERFALDAKGNRIATGPPGCPFCGGPVRVDDLASRTVLTVGAPDEATDSPSLSPDGSRVAFRRYRCARAETDCVQLAGIWVAPTAGGPWRRVTATGSCPVWAPDGRTLLYLDGADVRLVSPAGGVASLLAREGRCSAAFPPSWSPDSRRVALFQARPGRLVIVDVATRRVKVIADASIGVVVGFSWSPDSSSLLVAARPVPLACSSLERVDVTTGATRLLRAC